MRECEGEEWGGAGFRGQCWFGFGGRGRGAVWPSLLVGPLTVVPKGLDTRPEVALCWWGENSGFCDEEATVTGSGPDRLRYVSRAAVVSIVLGGLVEHDGPDAVAQRTLSSPVSGERWFAGREPTDHLAAVVVAGQVVDIAKGLVREWATAARGAGCSWEQIAAAMSIVDVDDPGVEAYLRLTDGISGSSVAWASLRWTCDECRRTVRDAGPWSANPADNETGHSPDCPRHIAEIDAHTAEWD